MLVDHAHRWRKAVLIFDSTKLIDDIFPFKPSSTHFPFLEDLSFRCYGHSGINSVLDPSLILECRPPLRKLELDHLSESYVDVIASRNSKVLRVSLYSGVSLARLLHVCPCLEFFALESFEFKGNPASQIACQSSLLTLDIGGDTDTNVDNGAWTGVTFPKLTKLDVTLPNLVDHRNWEAAYEPNTSLSELKEVLWNRAPNNRNWGEVF
ncbi:hypothetical protein BDP27DRAFT_769658 [Rhodocollybia butyracea]|uniref:Uncharacterized protein n=1 Tax=Rhodocollybia butyracea TaxID=206335 RepID=A0A9P5PVE3_9AGAR|nr:hypothetical protein BDP27DRAFT_769658 [Rhodocollybia butyracea]